MANANVESFSHADLFMQSARLTPSDFSDQLKPLERSCDARRKRVVLQSFLNLHEQPREGFALSSTSRTNSVAQAPETFDLQCDAIAGV